MSGILGRTLTLYIRDSGSVYRLVGQVQTKNFSHERALVAIADEIGQTHALNLNSGLRSISIGLSGVVPINSATNIIGYNLLKQAAMGVSDDPLTFKLTSDDIRIDGTGFISSFSETGQVSGAILYSASLMLDTSPTIDLAPVGALDLGSCVVVPFAIAGGTADALTATFSELTLVDGAEVKVRAAFANATATPTLNANGGGAVIITRLGNQALRVADIDGAGHEMTLRYVIASPVRWELLNPANADLFWSAPIGTIIEAPSAPNDGGTWFECNGQAIAQSTYSTLYALLGHAWAQFKIDGVGDMGASNVNQLGRFWHVGSGTYVYITTSLAARQSSDGIAWSGLPASPLNPAANHSLVVRGSTWLTFSTAGTTIGARTANSGTTWANQTWPAAFTQIIDNGTNFVGYTGVGTTIYSSSDGATWSTHAGVIPFSFVNGVLIWDGSNWLIVEQTTDSATTFNIYKTTISNASSGWTLVTAPSMRFGAIAASRTNGDVLSIGGKSCLLSSAQFTTNTHTFSPDTPHPQTVVYNGYVYVGAAESGSWETFTNNDNPYSAGVLFVSTNGRHWNKVKSPVLNGNILGALTVTGSREGRSNTYAANTSTGDIMVGMILRISSLSTINARYSALLKFNFTVASQFCLPELPGTTPRWIKAL